jgi:hypothetical protein
MSTSVVEEYINDDLFYIPAQGFNTNFGFSLTQIDKKQEGLYTNKTTTSWQ